MEEEKKMEIEEELIDKKGNVFNRELAEKAMYGETEELNEIVKDSREIYLNEIRYRKTIQMNNYLNDIYLVNQNWYNKWKEYVKYPQIKKTCKNPEIYLKIKPLIYKAKPENNPGIILNKDLLPEFNENILQNYEEPVIKTNLQNKKDYRILPKESFEILNKRFGCDYILKGKNTIDRISKKKVYNYTSKHFHLILIPNKKVLQENQKLIDINVYIPEFTTGKELNIFLSKIFNADYNKKYKEFIGIDELNEKSIKIYYLTSDERKNDFVSFFEKNIAKFKNGEKVDGSDYLKSFGEKTQMIQIPCLYFVLEFSELEEGEYFINIPFNIESEEESTMLGAQIYPRYNENNFYNRNPSENQNYGNSYENIISRKKEELSNLPLDKNDNKHGLVGLENIGNTCYMNTGLQCLSNCTILTNYFLNDYYVQFINKNNPIGSKGKLAEAYSEIIKHIWYGQQNSLEPYNFKEIIGEIRPMFKGYQQQDSQEFISFLLDGLHEDLNKVLKKPYIEQKDNLKFNSDIEEFIYYKKNFLTRNQSLIVDLFYGIFKSILYCPNPNCKNISNTFDPFAIISLSLNSQTETVSKNIEVYFLYENLKFRMLAFEMDIKKDLSIKRFRQKINYLLQVGVYGFEMFLLKDDTPILIDESEYNLMEELIGTNNKIFLCQIGSNIFIQYNEDIKNAYNQIIMNNDYITNKGNEFDKLNEIKSDKEEEIDKENWIRCVFDNYTYDIDHLNEEDKNNYPPKERFKPSRIFYVCKDWSNKTLFDFFYDNFSPIYDENNSFSQNLESYASDTENFYINPYFNLIYSIHDEKKYPFFLFFNGTSLIFDDEDTSMNIEKTENNIGKIFSISNKRYLIKEEIEKINSEVGKSIKDYQLNFNIVWYPNYLSKIKNVYEPQRIRKSFSYFTEIDGADLDLFNLFQNFSRKEKLTEGNKWFCPKCKEHQLAEKKMEIYSCPEILIIHLKRFKNISKLGNLVNFPIKGLDMGKYIYNIEEDKDYIYDLFGVANHQGGLSGGHYYAYCYNNIENKWYSFNDSRVDEIDTNNIVTKNAYILFYKKRNSNYPVIEELYNKPFEDIKYGI